MNKPLPLGINSWFNYQMPFLTRIQAIKKAGFDQTSLWWTEDSPDRMDYPGIVKEYGLEIDHAHIEYLCGNDIWDESEAIRNAVQALYLTRIRECSHAGVKTIVIHASKGKEGPGPNPYGMDILKTVLKAAGDNGINIAVENVGREDILNAVFNELDFPNLKYCYDSSHDWLYSQRKGQLLTQYGDKLVVTHLSDNDGLEDRHWVPGNGIVDWAVIASHFPVTTYQGALSLEVSARQDESHLTTDEFLSKVILRLTEIRDLIKNT